LLERVLPGVRIAPPPEAASLDPRSVFGKPVTDIWLEIGFGAGEHLATQAARNPDVGFVGCEPFVTGVASTLARIDSLNLHNVRILDDDARLLLGGLADACVGRVFVLFSDPWPKKRHHLRRFINFANLDVFARILRPGGEFRFATDHMDYVRWTLEHIGRNGKFTWLARSPADWRNRPDDWIETRYEAKALAEGKKCIYLQFERRPRDSDAAE
jgi:tRNA (guanine-N7-)-methyltransferase